MARAACVVALLATSIASACTDPSGTDVPLTPTSAVLSPPVVQPGIWTLDDEFEQLALRAPGFGGLFVDSLGRVTAYVKGGNVDGVRQEVAHALERNLPTMGVPASAIRTLPAGYDFLELRGWYRHLSPVVALPSVVQTDIDDRRNRIAIGVVPDGDTSQVRAVLRSGGIPDEVAVLETVPRTVFASTLQDVVRPTVGGLRIRANGLCTLSFNAHRVVWNGWGFDLDTSVRYFVTASHCTNVRGQVDGVTAGQPDAGHPIGVEIADPPFFTSSQNSQCPAGRLCRYSDAALFEYNGSTQMTFASIAKTGSGYRNITIVGAYTLSTIDPCPWCILVGYTVLRKVGATTGTTTGTVWSTCVDLKQYDQGIDTGQTALCQVQVGFQSAGGDSGAPVLDSGSGSNLIGIYWGVTYYNDVVGAPLLATYAPIGQALGEIMAASGSRIVPCASCWVY